MINILLNYHPDNAAFPSGNDGSRSSLEAYSGPVGNQQ